MGRIAVVVLGALLTHRLATELPEELGSSAERVATDRLIGRAGIDAALEAGTQLDLVAQLQARPDDRPSAP